jgi:nickel/cobalt transporter (NicO) family protein
MLGLTALLLGLLAPPQVARAHPLDVYLQATYITVAPTQIVVELDLSPGVLVAPQVLSELDRDGDEQITDVEGQAYVDALLQNVVLQVDGQPLALVVTKIDMPAYLTIQAGYGTIRVFTSATLAEDMTGSHELYYKNNYAPTGAAYQVNAFVDKGVAITLGKQNRDDIQQSLTMDYKRSKVIGSEVIVNTAPAAVLSNTTSAMTETESLATGLETATGTSGQARQLMAYLYEPTRSPWVLLLTLALAVVLGGLHALTPGHGKTLVAAYLVGSRGTVRHAVTLGAIVTFTHTASVIVIGLLALFASQFVVPNVLVPILEILSGLLVVFMGLRLVGQRWNAYRSDQQPEHDQAHDHSHSHDYPHEHSHSHDHGDGHVHSHLPPAEGIKLSNLLALGVSGGLVPCPEALGIMVIAIGLNRILLGLGLIVSFSFGLAAVLIIIGILLVRSRSLVERFGGISSRWSSALPLASAVIVTVLGVGITISGLAAYLG